MTIYCKFMSSIQNYYSLIMRNEFTKKTKVILKIWNWLHLTIIYTWNTPIKTKTTFVLGSFHVNLTNFFVIFNPPSGILTKLGVYITPTLVRKYAKYFFPRPQTLLYLILCYSNFYECCHLQVKIYIH